MEIAALQMNTKVLPETMLKHLCDWLKSRAKTTIQKGIQTKYKSFWTEESTELKTVSDEAMEKVKEDQAKRKCCRVVQINS